VSVLIATPSRGMTTTSWAMMLRRMSLPANSASMTVTGYRIDFQRNECVRAFLQTSLEWLLFLDDDVFAPPETFDRLSSHGLDVVSGLYYRKGEPIEPLAYVDRGTHLAVPDDFAIGKLVPVDFGGAGCLLIHRRVLETMQTPWFSLAAGDGITASREHTSEDFFFFGNARKAGFKTFVDTGVRCLHVGLGAAELGGAFVPFSMPVPGLAFSCGEIEPWVKKTKR